MSSRCPLHLSSSCPLIVLYLSSTSVGINKTSKHHRTTNKVPTGNAFTKVAALRDSPLQRLTPAVGKTKNIPRWPPSGLAFSYGCGLAGGYAAQVGALLCQHRCLCCRQRSTCAMALYPPGHSLNRSRLTAPMEGRFLEPSWARTQTKQHGWTGRGCVSRGCPMDWTAHVNP